MLKKVAAYVLGAALIAWIVFCATVYVAPQYFFYNPTNEKPSLEEAKSKGFGAKEVRYRAADDTELYGWFIPPQKGKKVIVYFHGNSYNIGAFYPKLQPFVDEGYGAFIGEYRGFGGIKGKLSEQNLAQDAKAAVKYLNSLGYRPSDMILYGMSMGSYTATTVAAEYGRRGEPFAGVVLEVPFDSILNVVRQRIWPIFPFEWIVKDKFDNTSNIKAIKTRLLIMGGNKDRTVPHERAQALFETAEEPKNIVIYTGADHSELYQYGNWRGILAWIKENEKAE